MVRNIHLNTLFDFKMNLKWAKCIRLNDIYTKWGGALDHLFGLHLPVEGACENNEQHPNVNHKNDTKEKPKQRRRRILQLLEESHLQNEETKRNLLGPFIPRALLDLCALHNRPANCECLHVALCNGKRHKPLQRCPVARHYVASLIDRNWSNFSGSFGNIAGKRLYNFHSGLFRYSRHSAVCLDVFRRSEKRS